MGTKGTLPLHSPPLHHLMSLPRSRYRGWVVGICLHEWDGGQGRRMGVGWRDGEDGGWQGSEWDGEDGDGS
jgi:hypothetical protein